MKKIAEVGEGNAKESLYVVKHIVSLRIGKWFSLYRLEVIFGGHQVTLLSLLIVFPRYGQIDINKIEVFLVFV